MKYIDKVKVFKEELSWIANPKIKEFAEKAISMLPDYFFEVAASSTGKFHPAYALGPGGLVRHTRAAVKIAHELLSLEMYGKYTADERDLMLVALTLHDGWKHGPSETAGEFTVAEHPTVCSDWIKNTAEFEGMLSSEQMEFICGCIASHMGQWNTGYRSKKEILPKPKTAAQKFVHQADYLASRKYLIFDFGDDYYKPEVSGPAKEESPDSDNTPEDALTPLLSDIVAICKAKIESGINRNDVYQVIKENNSGNRNPNSISDVEVAKIVKKKLEELNVA